MHRLVNLRATLSILVLSIITLFSKIEAAFCANAGMIQFEQLAISQHGDKRLYPLRITGDSGYRMSVAVSLMKRAVELDPSNRAARWGLGRVLSATGNYYLATQTLNPLILTEKHNLLLLADMIVASSQANLPTNTIALYTKLFEQFDDYDYEALRRKSMVVSHLEQNVAVSYLQLAKRMVDAGNLVGAEAFLNKAAALHPGNLYADYHLLRLAQLRHSVKDTVVRRYELAHFPPSGIMPLDIRLLGFTAEVVPVLISAKLWDKALALNVVAFLVWHQTDATEIEQLLHILIEQYPKEPAWRFYLAELYHRRGNWFEAAAEYNRVLREDPTYDQAYNRLGMVCEAQAELSIGTCDLTEALMWYKHYYQVVPNDLLSLKRILKIQATLGNVNPSFQTEWEHRTDDHRIVAELLGVPVDVLRLGPNLVTNGGFEQVTEGVWPKDWEWYSQAVDQRYNLGTFGGGLDRLDPLEGDSAARVDGFWIQILPSVGRARAGFLGSYAVGEVSLCTSGRSDSRYAISFDYRTKGSAGDSAGIWVSPTEIFFTDELFLPPTDGAWRHFTGVSQQNSPQTTSAPHLVLRSWGIGRVWFDNIRLQPICIQGDELPVPPTALFVIK